MVVGYQEKSYSLLQEALKELALILEIDLTLPRMQLVRLEKYLLHPESPAYNKAVSSKADKSRVSGSVSNQNTVSA